MFLCQHQLQLLEDLLVEHLAFFIDLVDNRHTGTELGLNNLLTRHVLQVHNQRAERVAVGRHEDRLASLHKRQDVLAVVWKHTVGRELERLTAWWRHVERAAPDVHLILTPLLTGVILVKTRELTVVTLVQGLILGDRNALLTNGFELNLERLLSTLQV